MTWTHRPTLNPGEYPDGAELEAILDQIDSLTAPGWTSYASSLSWTSSGTAPAFGNATITAEYRKTVDSDLIDVRVQVQFGTTTTFGTGVYLWGLPVAAASSEVGFTVGTGYGIDTGTQEYGGVVKIDTSGLFRVLPASNSTDSPTNWGQTAPFTWGSTDVFRAAFRYRIA